MNIEPATRVLIDLVEGVYNDELTAPTPRRECTLGGLLDHVSSLSMAFTAAAEKSQLDSGGPGQTRCSILAPVHSGIDKRSTATRRVS